jgi:hypothetical protein
MAQQSEEGNKKNGRNEIRLNWLMCVIGIPELNYERISTQNVGYGFAAAVCVDKPENIPYRYGFTPYFRVYFSKKQGIGFFIEGNMTAVHQNEITENWINDGTGVLKLVSTSQLYNSMGFGSSIGVKLMSKSGFTGEIFTGGGRLFGESVNGAYFRGGITLGKRF